MTLIKKIIKKKKNNNYHYVVTNEIKDGEYTYHDTGIWTLNDSLPNLTEKKVLIETFFGHDDIIREWKGWSARHDYRIVSLYTIKSVEKSHLDIINLYLRTL